MKTFKEFNELTEAKKCPAGQYYCFTDKKCKKIPTGYRMGYGGRLAPDNRSDSGDDNKNGKVMETVMVMVMAPVVTVVAMVVVMVVATEEEVVSNG